MATHAPPQLSGAESGIGELGARDHRADIITGVARVNCVSIAPNTFVIGTGLAQ